MFVCLFVCLFAWFVWFVCLVCLFVCLFVWFVWFGLVWFGLVWFGLVWFGLVGLFVCLFVCLFAWFVWFVCLVCLFVCLFVWFAWFVCLFVWFGLVWFGLVCLVWFGLVWFGLVWFGWLVCLFVCLFKIDFHIFLIISVASRNRPNAGLHDHFSCLEGHMREKTTPIAMRNLKGEMIPSLLVGKPDKTLGPCPNHWLFFPDLMEFEISDTRESLCHYVFWKW